MKHVRFYVMKRRYWNKKGVIITDILTHIPKSAYDEAMKRQKPLIKYQHGQYWYAKCYPQWAYRLIFKRRRRLKISKETIEFCLKVLGTVTPIAFIIALIERCSN